MTALSDFYLYNPSCNLENAIYENIEFCGQGFRGFQDPSKSDESLFYKCDEGKSNVVISSCAVSKKFSMTAKHSIDFNQSNIDSFSINSFRPSN